MGSALADAIDLRSLSTAVRDLVRAADAAMAVDPVAQPEAQALEDARALIALKERLDAHLLVRLHDVEQRRLHDYDALPTLSSWVEAQTSSLDRATLGLVHRLGRVPTVARELAEGRVSMLSAQRIARCLESLRRHLDRPDGRIDGLPGEDVLEGVLCRGIPQLVGEAHGGLDDSDPRLVSLLAEVREALASPLSQLARVEAGFVALARRVEGRLLPYCLEQLTDALLPVQLEERADKTHERRGLALLRNPSGRGGRLEADLDDEAFELAHAALVAAMSNDPDRPADTEAAARLRAQGLDPYVEGATGDAPRSVLARRHDAFAAVLRDWLGSGIAGLRDKAVPHILVRVGADALDGAPGALPAVGGSGRPLPMSAVRRWACDSAITRFVMTLGNRVIEMSHTVRTAKSHERKAKLMETGGRCQAAGCHPPPGTPLIPHHPEAYARSKVTSFYDTVMFCEKSHFDVHHGKVIRLKDGRLLNADGWIAQIHATG